MYETQPTTRTMNQFTKFFDISPKRGSGYGGNSRKSFRVYVYCETEGEKAILEEESFRGYLFGGEEKIVTGGGPVRYTEGDIDVAPNPGDMEMSFKEFRDLLSSPPKT